MLFVRSLAFNIAFYVNMVGWLIALLPTLLMPRRAVIRGVQAWARSSFVLMRVLAGTGWELRGADRIPPGGLLVASKHQSLWETFALLTLFDDPCFVVKRELTWIPFFGWYLRAGHMIAVDRGARSAAMKAMTAKAKAEIALGRQIIIFPEGTRRAADAPPSYKFGVSFLYDALGVACLPVALNSGSFWARRHFARRPGTIVVEIGEPIPAGLDRSVFFERMQSEVEAGSKRLRVEALEARAGAS